MHTVRVPIWFVVVAFSALGGALISSNLSRAVSQEQPPARPCDVGVIDISRVFEKSHGFQMELTRLKGVVNSFELVVKQANQEQSDLKQQLETLVKGSDPYRKLELELATKQANLQVEMKVKREGFLLDEAAIYAKWYRMTQKIVQDAAARKQLRLVLRFNSETINEKDRQSVLQGVNRPVVYQDRLDITEEVIKALNEA